MIAIICKAVFPSALRKGTVSVRIAIMVNRPDGEEREALATPWLHER